MVMSSTIIQIKYQNPRTQFHISITILQTHDSTNEYVNKKNEIHLKTKAQVGRMHMVDVTVQDPNSRKSKQYFTKY